MISPKKMAPAIETTKPPAPNSPQAKAPAPAPTPQNVKIDVTPDVQDPEQATFLDDITTAIKESNTNHILRMMRTINIILAILTITTGISCWYHGVVDGFQRGIASFYVILFGLLLLVFELRNDRREVYLRDYFGFMFHNKTRTIFLFLMAIWPLSIGFSALGLIDTICLFLNAIFNYYVIMRHPGFSRRRAEIADMPIRNDVSTVQGNVTTAPAQGNVTTAPAQSNITTAPVQNNTSTVPAPSNATTNPVQNETTPLLNKTEPTTATSNVTKAPATEEATGLSNA